MLDLDSKTFSQDVAAQVRAIVAKQGLKKKELAGPLRVKPEQVYLRMSGKVAFTLDELAILADVLGVSPAEFIPTEPAASSRAA